MTVMVREVRHGKGEMFGAYAASMGERGGLMRVLRVFVKDAVRVPLTEWGVLNDARGGEIGTAGMVWS